MILKYVSKPRIHPYSIKAPYTNKMQVRIQVEMEVRDFVVGDWDVTLVKIFVSIKSKVISKTILPGIISCGITKLIYKKIAINHFSVFINKKQIRKELQFDGTSKVKINFFLPFLVEWSDTKSLKTLLKLLMLYSNLPMKSVPIFQQGNNDWLDIF